MHRYCATAEEFQVANPLISAQNARLALESIVKLKNWQVGERTSLLSLTTDERFKEFIDSPELMKRIHYVRKIGNNAAHVGGDAGYVGRRESFFAVLNLYYIIGSVLLAWKLIDKLPDFNKDLIPQVATLGNVAVVPQPGQVATITSNAAQSAAETVEQTTDETPATVNAQPIVNDLSEAETRKLYIDLLLHEAGWKVSEKDGEIIPRQACTEIEVHGMYCLTRMPFRLLL